MKKPEKLKRLLNHLYDKWVVQSSDAIYYGSGADAVKDFIKLFKALGKRAICEKIYKSKRD